jgi:hypothetical protein
VPHKDKTIRREYLKLFQRRYSKLNPEKRMFNHAKRRAKQHGLDFKISLEDIKIPSICPILGIPIFPKEWDGNHGPADNSPSLDRIDNSKGYLKDNVAVISSKANHKKSDLTLDQIKNLYNYAHRL